MASCVVLGNFVGRHHDRQPVFPSCLIYGGRWRAAFDTRTESMLTWPWPNSLAAERRATAALGCHTVSSRENRCRRKLGQTKLTLCAPELPRAYPRPLMAVQAWPARAGLGWRCSWLVWPMAAWWGHGSVGTAGVAKRLPAIQHRNTQALERSSRTTHWRAMVGRVVSVVLTPSRCGLLPELGGAATYARHRSKPATMCSAHRHQERAELPSIIGLGQPVATLAFGPGLGHCQAELLRRLG